MADLEQKRRVTPIAASASYSVQLELPTEGEVDPKQVLDKGNVAATFGGKYKVKTQKKTETGEKTRQEVEGLQVPVRYATVSADSPGNTERFNSISFGSSVGLQYNPPAWERFKGALVFGGGGVWRNFSLLENQPAPEAGVDPKAPLPSEQECQDAVQDNPFASPEDCQAQNASRGSIQVPVNKPRTGLETSLTLKGNVNAIKRSKVSMLGISLEGRIRVRGVPVAGEPNQWATSLQPSARVLVGVSTPIHPAIGKFFNLKVRVGREWSGKDWNMRSWDSAAWLIIIGAKFNFDVAPKGLKGL